MTYFFVYHLSERDGWVLTTFVPTWLSRDLSKDLEMWVAEYAERFPDTIYFVGSIIPE